MAVGKDVYVDSSLMIDIIVTKLAKLGAVITTPADKAYEAWGISAFREVCSGVLPVHNFPPEFIKDRQTIFPMLKRPDFSTLRPSALAGLKSRLREVEYGFLANSSGPFIGGEKVSLADMHVVFGIRWALKDLGAGKEPGFGKDEFPKVWRMIEGLPESRPEVLSAEQTHEKIRGAEYWAKGPTGVTEGDLLGIAAGTQVSIESFE
jgi:glutathione S-transferase